VDELVGKDMAQISRLVCYVDLATGISVRREMTSTLHHATAPEKDVATVAISQAIAG
jgi:hypothetical protein